MPDKAYLWLWVALVVTAIISWIISTIYFTPKNEVEETPDLAEKDAVHEDFEVLGGNPNVRTCDTYFVPPEQVNACDANYFDIALTKLRYDIAELEKKANRTRADNIQLADMKLALTARTKGTTVCKLTWPNMYQNSDVEKDPMKNSGDPKSSLRNGYLANGNLKETSEDWAFCYQRVQDAKEGAKIKNKFGDKGAVLANTVLKKEDSPFRDNEMYLRYQFRNLQKDELTSAYCDLRPSESLPSGFPEVLIGFTMTTSKYETRPGMDYIGNDIACFQNNESVGTCISKCDNDPSCVGVAEVKPWASWGARSGCCLKHKLANLRNKNTTFVKMPGAVDNVAVMTVTAYKTVYDKKGGAKLAEIKKPVNVFRQLLEVYYEPKDNALYVREKPRNAVEVCVLQKDVCERIRSKERVSKPATSILNVSPMRLMYVTNKDIFSLGSGIQALQKQIIALDKIITSQENYKKKLTKENNTIIYKRQVIRKDYYINPKFEKSKYYGPHANTHKDMIDLFGVDGNNLNGNFISLAATRKLDTIFVGRDGAAKLGAYYYEGAIRVGAKDVFRPGQYRFKINSDDASEFVLNGIVTSTHYGYHGDDGRGIEVVTNIDLREGYHPFIVRYFQWRGGSGLQLYYLYRENDRQPWPLYPKDKRYLDWKQIPKEVLYHNAAKIDNTSAILATNEIIKKMNEKKTECGKVITALSYIPNKTVKQFVKRAEGVPFGSHRTIASQVSSDGNIYVATNIRKNEI